MIRSSCGNPVSVTIHQLLLLFPGSLQATQTLYRSRLIVRRGVGRFEPPVRTWLSQKKSRNCRFEPPVHPRTGSGCCRFARLGFADSPARRFAGASLDRFAGWPVQRFNGSAGWLSRFEPAVRTWPSRKVSESAGSNSSSPVRPPVRRFALVCLLEVFSAHVAIQRRPEVEN